MKVQLESKKELKGKLGLEIHCYLTTKEKLISIASEGARGEFCEKVVSIIL
jgi:Asp-tRNA(Asn)/Glu-tRNA(Gln) amidotransferase B subunit